MPQGQAAVIWSEKKDVELFLTVLAVQKITIDYAAVAAAFGMHISLLPPPPLPNKLFQILLDDPFAYKPLAPKTLRSSSEIMYFLQSFPLAID